MSNDFPDVSGNASSALTYAGEYWPCWRIFKKGGTWMILGEAIGCIYKYKYTKLILG